MDPWVKIMFSSLRDIVYLAALAQLPRFVFNAVLSVLSGVMLIDLKRDKEFAMGRVANRLKKGTDRKDFMSPILTANDEKGMTIPEIESSFNIIIVAGSETTATLLSGALFHLTTHPAVMQRLLSELRREFSSRSAITMARLQSLPYLNAVLEETLRVYPPSAFAQARIVPPEGAIICGVAVPGGTSVGVASLAASLSASNWTEPHAFKPERWIGEPWAGDDRQAMQPFLLGPRNCVGKK
ncbi:hypothetical protein MMC32_008262 [Xylographa parallela]|nr:hypothetical protein [Xylographa parallela]